MKNNTKFLLMYIAILFSFALVLILFAGLTQNNYAKELAESQGIKQNLVDLTEQNQTLTDSIKVLNKQVEEAKAEITICEQKIEELNNEKNVTTLLVEALELYEDGEKEKAAEKIAEIDKTTLTEAQLYIYNKIK